MFSVESLGTTHFSSEERMVGKDEKCAMGRTAKDKVDGTLGYINLANLLACRVVDEYLSVGNEDVALAIDCHALTAAIGKGF
jgi:hypothetical protein